MNWRDDAWYVLVIARILDLTPQAVRDLDWPQIQDQLGEEGLYRVAKRMSYTSPLNAEYYTRASQRLTRTGQA